MVGAALPLESPFPVAVAADAVAARLEGAAEGTAQSQAAAAAGDAIS